MSTMYFIGIRIPNAFVAHQPSRLFHWSVWLPPIPPPYLNGPVPTAFLTLAVLPETISFSL
jgi:hypothetical protein